MTSSSPKKHRTTFPPPRTNRGLDQVEGFDAETGWALVPDVLTGPEVAAVAAACHELLPLDRAERARRDRPAGGTRHLGDLRGRVPHVDDLVTDGALAEMVTEILGPDPVIGEVGYRCPRPGFGAQYLHADASPKLDGGPDQVATAIVLLCEFNETNGATRVVPGSHLRPDLQRVGGRLESHPDEIRVLAPAGSAIVFSGHLLHSGTTNESTSERPALQVTWSRRAR